MKVGFPGLLFLVFLVLKLTHHIAWSWLWVTMPLWAGLAIFALIMGGMFLFALAATLMDGRR